jgi:glycosidase
MKIILGFLALLLLVGLVLFTSCRKKTQAPAPVVELADSLKTIAPDWAKNANIYEVNIRQFSPEGNFAGLEKHLDRLDSLGVDVVWLMPIHPISKAKRKGTLGSYYAVADYKKVNPEYGTLDDFKHLVAEIHRRDMKIILDWVPNHTGWDHPWIKEHPDFYTQDAKGNIIDPIDPQTGKSWGWTDVADLNYDNQSMRAEMISDMNFWLREADIDGFRVDVAHNVPDDFYHQMAPGLREVKDVFMLAEAENPYHRNSGAFAASYAWSLHHLMNEVAQGKSKPGVFDKWLVDDRSKFKRGYHMLFITNHDENSWNGTEYERMKDAVDVMAVFAFTFDGMPLLYNGQESAFNRRLLFFEKDSVDWGNYSKSAFYKTLLDLKHKNQALWNGEHGGAPVKIPTGKDDFLYAFKREKNGDKVAVFLNLSAENQEIKLKNNDLMGTYNDVFSKSTMTLTEESAINLGPWGYLVLSNK